MIDRPPESVVPKGREGSTESIVRCSRFQCENIEPTKFCRECGSELIGAGCAPTSGFERMESYSPKHLSEGILSRTSAMEGERKQVTVLFADVANFTSMAGKLDPEDVHQIMDGCFRILMNEVHKFEGTINQFTGDGVMALCGVPSAHEDSAQRACHAALGMQSSLQGYAQDLKVKFGLDFKMRIGISSGTVVVGPIGDNLRMDYTSEGDTTNVAARMETMAGPGCILVSQETYRKVAPYFEFRPLGPLAVKGKGGP
jgi:class 3 adenylate cyclase